jgi:hypothetical protein
MKNPKRLTERALRVALRKPAPLRFTLTGPSIYDRDFILTHLRDSEGRFVFLATSISSEFVEGLWFAPERKPGSHGEARQIPLSDLGQFQFYAEYYCRELEHHYKSAFSYLWWGELSAHARLWWRRGDQWIFNQKRLARTERLDLLRKLVQEYLTGGRDNWSYVEIITSIEGPRWIRHPAKDEIIRHYRLLLASLVESGEIALSGSAYKIVPRSMVTLHQHETEEQRHSDMRWQSILMFVLTLCLVVTGAVQAAGTVVGMLKDFWSVQVG